jgi:hypothetical protein
MTSIHTALTEFLDEQHAHLSDHEYRDHTSIIFHLKRMLVLEGFGSGDSTETRQLYDKAVDTGREDDVEAFFKAVDVKLIIEITEFFLRHHLRHEVTESKELEQTAVPVMTKLTKFLADRKYISKAAARRAKSTIECALDDDDDYEVYDSDRVAELEREAGDTIRLIPHDPYLPLILGQAKELAQDVTRSNELGIVNTDGVKMYLPACFAARRALKALQRITCVIRPLFDTPEGAALYAPDGRVKHPPLHLVKLHQADVNMLVAAAESLRWAWGPAGNLPGPEEIQTLEGLLEEMPQGWELLDPYDRLEAVLTLDVDDDMRTLIEIIRAATADVALTADQESAYQRVTARLTAALAPTVSQCPRCGNSLDIDSWQSAVSDEDICSRCTLAEEQDMEQGKHPDPRDTWPVHRW